MDNDLVKRARNGDKTAFAKLYISYKDKLYRYAYFKLGNTHDAMDAVSNCITQAYLSIYSLKSEKAFSAWIFKILYRECCTILSKKAVDSQIQDIDGLNIESPQGVELAPELKEALSILYDDEKDIVLLSVIAGYNSKELGSMLGIKASTVRSKLSRALAKMRKYLE